MPKKRKAVLAGGTGFLGSALYRDLQGSYDFTVLPRRFEGARVASADVLFHVAGVTAGRRPEDAVGAVYQENWTITLRLLDLCRQARIPRMVFASSYVYGQPRYLPVDEKHPVEALTPYMHSKILCEELIRGYTRWTGLHAVCLRLFNPYGPGQRRGVVIADILAQIDQKVITLGDPRPKRDFIYVDDVVRAFDLAARSGLVGFEVLNIGSGQSIAIQDMAQKLKECAGSSARLAFENRPRAAEIQDVVADIRKARAALGWSPEISLEEGLKRLVQAKQAEIHV